MVITTRFIGPTNTRGARIRATFPGRDFSVTVSLNYALSGSAAHMEAAQVLVAKWNRAALDYAASINQAPEYASTIDGTFHCVGQTPDERGYVFARVETYADAFNAVSTAGMETAR